jgi:uncharacterized membrane protein YhhN
VIRQAGVVPSGTINGKSAQIVLTLMLGLLVVLIVPAHPYSAGLVTLAFGLAFQILGDFLLVSRGYNRIRFITYSLAALLYSVAYWIQTDGITSGWLPILLASSGIVLLLLILPQVESRVFSSSLFGTLLLGLLWATGELWIQQHSMAALLALFGAGGLFMTSLLIAFRKDRCVFYSQCQACLIVYVVSQTLLVLSVLL